ncbi:outer membrane lipoprotein carrier protein LolA [uncultured Jatrophihabitans sp.]|uniref:LolA family protein n=1 Tax=uncultured Jatrophihabitans sp. TaxID=1610747 RepID=UPI0035CB4A47
MAAAEIAPPPAAKLGRARRRLPWAAPFVVAGAVAAGVLVVNASTSAASPNLPARTAKQLLIAVQSSRATTFSGDIREVANLGLPSLPGAAGSSASLSWQTFVAGSHSARVWSDGVDKQRVALLGELSEADVIHNGRDVWTYTSQSNTVTHSVVPKGKAGETAATADQPTPAAVADQVLKTVGPSTAVHVDPPKTVAGRSAYTLVLAPRDANSTVREVTIAIDAAKHIPLRVQVFGAASSPAFEIGFTTISFAKPAASTFAFHLPKGATLSNDPLGASSNRHDGRRFHHDGRLRPEGRLRPAGSFGHRPSAAAYGAKPKVIGSDWTSVVEASGGDLVGGLLGGSNLNDVTTAVGTSGMRLLHTALINVVLLPDGRVFAGAVKPTALEHIAASAPR